MSGFEVIGVIFAVYPCLVDALALYKNTKAGKGAASLSRNLKTESIIFGEFVYHLLAPSVSDDEYARLKDPKSRTLGLWENPKLQSQLMTRLGSEKAKLVVEILQEMKEILSSLELELSPDRNEHSIELLRKFRATIRNVKHNLPQSSLRDQLEELTGYNEQLQRLLTDRSLPNKVFFVKRAVAPKRYLRREYGLAVDVYNALCNGYQCDCDAPHLANFCLPRLSDNFQADSSGLITNWHFEFIFPVGDLGMDNNGSMSAAEFMASWSKLDTDASNSAGKKYRRQNSHSICMSECDNAPSGKHQGPISDLCIIVKSLDTNAHLSNTSLGILRVAEKQYELQVPVSMQDDGASTNIVCLNELLTDQCFPLSRQERMNLALRLSYAILEFHSTPWIEPCWTWQDFCIDKHNQAQLFVTQKFYSSRSRRLSSCSKSSLSSVLWTFHGEPILTRLGFALIELAMGKRLAELRRKEHGNNLDPDAVDFLTAKDLIDSGRIRQEEGRYYESVVKTCLNHEYLRKTDLVRLDSSRPTFQDNVEEHVIAPLHKHWTANWGSQVDSVVY